MEAAVEKAMCVLRAVFYAGQTGGLSAEGVQPVGVPEETETGGAKTVAFEQ